MREQGGACGKASLKVGPGSSTQDALGEFVEGMNEGLAGLNTGAVLVGTEHKAG